ncbi:MAG TPA: 4Fe-4S dicluster domain-containing protein [Negativicutes bacterium]|nr:4Fe-4S dicluster domain-containing protein [Negativicutes bacterium]
MPEINEISKIRRKVLTELAQMTFEGRLHSDVENILHTVVTEEGPRYRCCVHKERAVLQDRVKSALSQPMDISMTEAAGAALAGVISDSPIIQVLPVACDQCPLDRFIVTDACRNCLAHSCIASCPKKAISVVANRSFIDKTKCVECGLCKRSCPYGAIIEISRPCERACELGAIAAGKARKAVIDYTLCVHCGACKMACPFGAISDRSMIVQVIQQIKAGRRVYALLAPAFIGQFGIQVRPGQVLASLKKVGFHDTLEVSVGADAVAVEEAREFIERNREPKGKVMTTSCCPAFVGMVEKHLPAMKDNISSLVSPMVAAAMDVKKNDPEGIVVFVGPCIAKKSEAQRYPGIVDFVLTFEELATLIVGAGVNVTEMDAGSFASAGSKDGNIFARAGGVLQAVQNVLSQLAPDVELQAERCEGLGNCKKCLQEIEAGKRNANLFEGMACTGGCVGGPGVLTDSRITTKLVENFAGASPEKSAVANPKSEELIKLGLHRPHEQHKDSSAD